MRNRVLLIVVPVAFGLNAWLGERVKVGAVCPVLTSPSAVTVPVSASDDPTACVRECPVRVVNPTPDATAPPVS